MTESEFLALADATLNRIESALEQVAESADLDIESSRAGNVLEIELIDEGAKIIVNSQAPMQEMWVAAKAGGFHYRYENGRWVNTRDGSELFAALSRIISAHSGQPVVLQSS